MGYQQLRQLSLGGMEVAIKVEQVHVKNLLGFILFQILRLTDTRRPPNGYLYLLHFRGDIRVIEFLSGSLGRLQEIETHNSNQKLREAYNIHCI